MLVTHMPNEIAATTLFLFQMAMLEALMSSCRCILEEEKGRTGHTREARLTAKRLRKTGRRRSIRKIKRIVGSISLERASVGVLTSSNVIHNLQSWLVR